MRVIICGADQVGASIASYLSKEDNDITVVDHASDDLSYVSGTMDVNTVAGHPCDPDTLSAAGANESDMIIAVTNTDEVNMMACQIGHSLFGVPKKIARIRRQSYLDPSWSNLFSRAHMPIDAIISPEILVAEDIMRRLSVPGTTGAVELGEGKAYLISMICMDDCPVLQTPITQLRSIFPDLSFSVISISRKNRTIIPDEHDVLYSGDEVHLVVDSNHLRRVLAAFGHMEKEARKIIVSGGGNIGFSLIQQLQERLSGVQIKVIEQNSARADFLSQNLTNSVVFHGNTLEKHILEEVGVSKAETYIALTNDDESNILGSLLAKQYGCDRTITLVNNNAYYSLVGPLGVDTMVSPKTIIVANVMQYVRRGRIKAIHTLHDGDAELMEIEVSEASRIAQSRIADLALPPGVVICAILRDGGFMIPKDTCEVLPKDHLIILSMRDQARQVEKLLSVYVDLF